LGPFLQAIVDNLNKGFSHLQVYNTSKIISPKYYPSDEVVRITMSKQWLERLVIKFGLITVESNASRAELLEFVEIEHECENKLLHEAWQFYRAIYK
jgi:hypothetical protein